MVAEMIGFINETEEGEQSCLMKAWAMGVPSICTNLKFLQAFFHIL